MPRAAMGLTKRFLSGLATLALATTTLAATLPAGEIGYVEKFALSPDRAASLEQLVPGTDDYYFYHSLHALQTEQFAKVESLLKAWRERHPGAPRVLQIEHRLRLATYGRDPKKSLEYLRHHLGVPLHHQQEVPGKAPDLPTTLNQDLISRATLLQRELSQPAHLAGLTPSAWNWLDPKSLTPDQRRLYLQKLERPDVPGLVAALVADLSHEPKPEFGSYAIHSLLTRAQYDELSAARPDLKNHQAFVSAYLVRLQPAPDDDWRHDVELRTAYLARLQSFVTTLAPVHNSLQANILYQRLVHDRQQDKRDKTLFLKYLALPRNVPYLSRKMLESAKTDQLRADITADFQAATLMPPIRNDEPLVRDYLLHFLRDAADASEFLPFVNDRYLNALHAEAKIVNGLGDNEKWASQLSAEAYRALQQRVDIDFVSDLAGSFPVGQPVVLELNVKNVPQLIVKVFEINANSYYRQKQQEIDTDIELDGLVANQELVFRYDDGPERRVKRRFEFPQLTDAGTYVVDFIGNGKSSRALIRKGRLRPVLRTTAAGPQLAVFDEQDRRVKEVTAWIAGHEYKSDADGRITLPFSASNGPTALVLSAGRRTTLEMIELESESYALQAGFHVERESLLADRNATLVVRAGLYLNETLVSAQLLEDVQLEIFSTNLDDVTSYQTIRNIVLANDRELIQTFKVPRRLASLKFVLRGQVRSLVTGKQTEVTASESLQINMIDKTEKIEDLHLVRSAANWVLELRGKTGEPRPDRGVQLSLQHRDFSRTVDVSLKSDATGRIQLGALVDIASIKATTSEGKTCTWPLPDDRHQSDAVIHVVAGETLRLPYVGAKAATPSRTELSLLELRTDKYVADHFERLAAEGGMLELRKLPAGEYELRWKRSEQTVRVRVIPGVVGDRFVVGKLRMGELPLASAPQIVRVLPKDGLYSVQLANASPTARVHVFASRYEPAFDAFDSFSHVAGRAPRGFLAGYNDSAFVTSRNIGDEYRYILDRRLATRFPGNSLERPSLLLNPWALRSTATGAQSLTVEERFGTESRRTVQEWLEGAGGGMGGMGAGRNDDANLDFLANGAVVLTNLVPDKTGVVTIPKPLLKGNRHLQVVVVDVAHVTAHHASFEVEPAELLDLRLTRPLDAEKPFTMQRRVTALAKGQTLTVSDAASSRIEMYDTLASLHRLYAALSKNSRWNEFSFVTRWHKLKPEEKRANYSQYACHELNLFLAKKDPEFFAQVVKPYLANKKDATFVDLWLTERPLENFAEPWRFEQLNALERALLGRRLPDERPRVARHLTDQLDLLPRDAAAQWRQFEAAVMASVLDAPAVVALGDVADSRFTDAGGVGTVEQDNKRQLSLAIQSESKTWDVKDGKEVSGRVANLADDAPAVAHKAKVDRWYYRNRVQAGEAAEVDEKVVEQLRREMPQRRSFRKSQRDADGDLETLELSDDVIEVPELAGNVELRGKLRKQLYRVLDPTQEWAETNYDQRPIAEQSASLIPVNAFWAEFAGQAADRSFLPRNAAEPTRSFADMLTALAMVDLPFEPAAHDIKGDAGKIVIQAGSPMIVFHEEILPAERNPAAASVLVTQNIYRRDDRQTIEEGEAIDKFVEGELLTHVVYGCQVVVTNPTSRKQRISVLTQIPAGAIAVSRAQATRAHSLDLAPFHTQTFEYEFYFPAAGDFSHFPVHVARGEQLIAHASPRSLHVVAVPTKPDAKSWAHVSQAGSDDEVLAFLQSANLLRLDLAKIAFRMREKTFFRRALDLLAARHTYEPTLWGYGFLHDDKSAVREYLRHHDAFVRECGGWFTGELLDIDPVARREYQHLEYSPLVNARAHALGTNRQIVNDRFHQQYVAFLNDLAWRPQLQDDDWLAVVYYLLLQDRVGEALDAFAKVKIDRLATRLQYDYVAAYLEFFRDDPKQARAIAQRYVDHPVDRWRNKFRAIVAQLDELEGKAEAVIDPTDRNQQQSALAASAPSLELQAEGELLRVRHRNVTKFTVNYYRMDVELLFSRQPFLREFAGQFAAIRPNETRVVDVADNAEETKVELPESLRGRNVLVEIDGGGVRRTHTVFATTFRVQVVENYGHLRVTDAKTDRPLSKVYVKVYARHQDGSVKFYKDGYTDIRGRFEYASLSTADLETAERFAILVLGENEAATIREARVPER